MELRIVNSSLISLTEKSYLTCKEDLLVETLVVLDPRTLPVLFKVVTNGYAVLTLDLLKLY